MKILSKEQLMFVSGGWGACRTVEDCKAIEKMQEFLKPSESIRNVSKQMCTSPDKNGRRYCTQGDKRDFNFSRGN